MPTAHVWTPSTDRFESEDVPEDEEIQGSLEDGAKDPGEEQRSDFLRGKKVCLRKMYRISIKPCTHVMHVS